MSWKFIFACLFKRIKKKHEKIHKKVSNCQGENKLRVSEGENGNGVVCDNRRCRLSFTRKSLILNGDKSSIFKKTVNSEFSVFFLATFCDSRRNISLVSNIQRNFNIYEVLWSSFAFSHSSNPKSSSLRWLFGSFFRKSVKPS